VTGLIAAIRYLTIVPVPGSAPYAGSPGAAAAWFPVVGLLVGGVVVLVDRGATAAFAPILATVVTVTAWKVLTGGLHLDGLADSFDGLMGRDPAHRLEIMRDSRVGSFGAIGLVLFLLLEIAALMGIDPRVRAGALVLAPVAGRATAPLLARVFPAPPSGQGASFRERVPRMAAPVSLALAAVVAVAALRLHGLLALGVAIVLALAIGAFMTRRLGGVTGDVHGAAVELGELAVLLTVAAAYPAR
jgi:adenosylcobinamide-GDP ribazoletransferase